MAENISSAQKQLHDCIALAEKLIDRCQVKTNVKGTAKLARKIQSELKFLKSLKKKDDKNLQMHLKSTNLVHLQAVVEALESLPNVTDVIKTYHLHQDSDHFNSGAGMGPVYVDVVCNHGYTWTKVVARKPMALHLIWAGGGQFGDRSIEDQASQYMQFAAHNPRHFTTPQVIFIFVQGITSQLKSALEKTGVIVQGNIEELDSDLELKLQELKDSYEDDSFELEDKVQSALEPECVNYDNEGDNDEVEEEEELLSATEQLARERAKTQQSIKRRQQQSSNHSSAEKSTQQQPYKNNINNKGNIETLEELFQNQSNITSTNCRSSDPPCNMQKSSESEGTGLSALASPPFSDNTAIPGICDSSVNNSHALLSAAKNNTHLGSSSLLTSNDAAKTSNTFDHGKTPNCDKDDSNRNLAGVFPSLSHGGSLLSNKSDRMGLAKLECSDKKCDVLCGASQCNNRLENSTDIDRAVKTDKKDDDCINDAVLQRKRLFQLGTDILIPPVSVLGNPSKVNATSSVMIYEQPVINKLNLDISTLISYVSNVCHGSCNLVFREPILSGQAAEERERRLLPMLQEEFKGKELYICETALKSFHSILNVVGGPTEIERAAVLLKTVTVVPDSPSDRIARLETSAKIKRRAKVIFGTGDSLKAMTVTANVGFVRAAEQKGLNLAVYVHQSRALTEQKEHTATVYKPEEEGQR